jgi:hypothetical protein
VAGIRDLFEESSLQGWEKDLALLETQLDAHALWVRAVLLSRARQTNRLPPEIYADNLRNFAVKADPRVLIDPGMLPPDLLEQAVMKPYVPSRLAARSSAAAN